MNRNQTIATVAATTGIFAATIVAGISIMQASASTETASELPVLTAATTGTPNSTGLTFTPQPLPELPTLPTSESSGSKPNATSKSKSSAEPTAAAVTADSKPTQNAPVATISRASAESIVLAASEGKVTGVEEVTRAGLSAFAVTLARSDGSVITGYVDSATGTIFDWVINKKAPAPTATYNDDHDEDDDREHDDDDDDEYEGKREHEGDDDDD